MGRTVENVVQPLIAPLVPLKKVGDMVERWNPMPQIKMPTIPGPTKEQLDAQAAQARLLNEQANQIKATEDAAAASARARRARQAGRGSLLLDEVGIIDGTRPVQSNLGA
jgi:chromatin segregation and condensation protein Rec8/ScpA/Scc1 (kleisin family)